jgi:hypothetical protein
MDRGSTPRISTKLLIINDLIMKKVTLEEEVEIYRRFLINLHTASWVGRPDLLQELMHRLANYSYARTNTNGHSDEEEQREIETLLALDKQIIQIDE